MIRYRTYMVTQNYTEELTKKKVYYISRDMITGVSVGALQSGREYLEIYLNNNENVALDIPVEEYSFKDYIKKNWVVPLHTEYADYLLKELGITKANLPRRQSSRWKRI